MESIILLSSDKKPFTLPLSLTSMLTVFDKLPKDLLHNHISKSIPLELDIDSSLLVLIIAYCNNHNGTEPKRVQRPIGNTPLNVLVKHNCECNVLKSMDLETVTLLISAAEKVGCVALIDVCLAYLASVIRDNDLSVLAKMLRVGSLGEFNEEVAYDISKKYGFMKINLDRICELENDCDG